MYPVKVSYMTVEFTAHMAAHSELWFLVNDQREAQFFSMYLFLTLYMFRAHRAHHQERPAHDTATDTE